jgi:DNA-binding MarR family transcriptional regulator/ribosomal protein S18 acetylase RimI-like enzyme
MDRREIDGVRRFSRELTRRLGVLTDSFLGRGRALSEARVLYETGSRGAQVRDLRRRLELDSGYLSRLLRSLERQGLVRLGEARDDARATTVKPTRKGLAELKALDQLSDQYATSVLEPLSDSQRERLVASMSEVERLMRAAAVEIAPADPRSPGARGCLKAYFRELDERFDKGFDPGKSISADAVELMPPRGFFILASLDGIAIGCAALKVKERGTGEVKRMWVAREARGLKIGERLLRALETRAREAGLRTLRLETNRTLKEAQSLYRRSGYHEVAPFNAEPYAHHWFEKRLDALPKARRQRRSGCQPFRDV